MGAGADLFLLPLLEGGCEFLLLGLGKQVLRHPKKDGILLVDVLPEQNRIAQSRFRPPGAGGLPPAPPRGGALPRQLFHDLATSRRRPSGCSCPVA